MEYLPEEILEVVFCYLSPYREYDTVSLVCKKWNQVVKRMYKQMSNRFNLALHTGKTEWCRVDQVEQATYVSPRIGQSTCYSDFARSLYLFGGKSASRNSAGFNDLLRFDLHSLRWHRPCIKGAIPPPKYGCSLLSYKEFLILFGGSSLPPTNTLGRGRAEYSSELHIYDTVKETWTLKTFLENESPPPLLLPCMCILVEEDDPELDSMYVYGGQKMESESLINNEMWCLNLSSLKWEKQLLKGDCPNSVNSHSSMWMCKLKAQTYSNALFLLSYSLSHCDAWKLLRTGFVEWTSEKVSFHPSPSGYVPSMCTLPGQTCVVVDNMVAIVANPGTPHIMPLEHEIQEFKVLRAFGTASNDNKPNALAAERKSNFSSISRFACLFLLDLSNIETKGVVQWVDQLQSEKLKPCFIGRLTSSNVHVVLGRGEIILHGVLKQGNSMSMGLYNIRQKN